MGVVHPIKLKTRLACILEAGESTRLRMEESLPNHHEDHIAGKRRTIHYSITIWYTNLFLASSKKKFQQQKQQWIRNGRNWRKISAWNLTKVRSKKEVIDEARTKGAKVHFASLMEICHLKNAELEAKHQKYKGRVVLRGDIVKDDSGSYAVFTEQGSSASQDDSSKSHGYHIQIARVCDGQAADAVSAKTQEKWKMLHKLLKIPKSECPDI